MTELIPTFVQGWFLLQDAGLDAQEKNMILTALKDNFSVERVAQELRNQWPDQDLRHKDQSGRSTAWTVDEAPSDDDMAIGDRQGPDMGYLVQYGMNEEGLSIVEEAESEAQEALAMMDHGRKTLREARAKQHQVKMSRQYYRSYTSGNRSSAESGQYQVLELWRDGPQSGTVPKACLADLGQCS